jgi:hypothetical protein
MGTSQKSFITRAIFQSQCTVKVFPESNADNFSILFFLPYKVLSSLCISFGWILNPLTCVMLGFGFIVREFFWIRHGVEVRQKDWIRFTNYLRPPSENAVNSFPH